MVTESADDPSKRPKTVLAKSQANGQTSPSSDLATMHAKAAAAYIPFLTKEMLMPPKLPTRDEMENVILDLRKRALVDQYFGDEDS
jgi:pre-mRNA-splicing factor ISY1